MHSALLIGCGVELLNGDGEKGEDGGGLYLDRSSFTSLAGGHYVGRLSGYVGSGLLPEIGPIGAGGLCAELWWQVVARKAPAEHTRTYTNSRRWGPQHLRAVAHGLG